MEAILDGRGAVEHRGVILGPGVYKIPPEDALLMMHAGMDIVVSVVQNLSNVWSASTRGFLDEYGITLGGTPEAAYWGHLEEMETVDLEKREVRSCGWNRT